MSLATTGSESLVPIPTLRIAGPVPPDDPDDLARLHIKRHILQILEPINGRVLAEDFHRCALREFDRRIAERMIRFPRSAIRIFLTERDDADDDMIRRHSSKK